MKSLRRGLCAASVAGGAAVAALTMWSGPAAVAAPDPCAASEVAKTVGSVAVSTGAYLDAHPDTNRALTAISQQPAGPQSLTALKAYFDANPQAGKEMQQLQQPLTSLSTRCKLPISLPQLLVLMQAAQAPAALPGAVSAAQAVGAPTAALPAQPVPASVVTPGTGPLPGPATAGVR